MSVCCIGGVCIPYSAIFPLILFGLKWLVLKLAALGVIPQAVVNKLGIANQVANPSSAKKEASCCCAEKDDVTVRTARMSSASSSVSSLNATSHGTSTGVVETVDSMEDWNQLLETTKDQVVVVKFTATWCKPCKEIQPFVQELASQLPHVKFVEVDVDDLDEVASEFRVSMMPTFVCLKQQQVVGTLTGSSQPRLESFVQEHASMVQPVSS